jgi:tetratricopeptide (TPR) repeat protein
MKVLIFVILTVTCKIGLCQSDTNKILIQNFYESCKAKTYSAFLAFNKGVQLLDTKQYDRAFNSFEKTLEKDSTCCDAWFLIGFCHQQRGEYEKAIQACDKSLRLDPNNPSALVIKASTLFLMKKDTLTATNLFQKA